MNLSNYYLWRMGYKISKFDINFKGQSIAVAVHTVTDAEETSHIVSLEDHENFEIKSDQNNNWKADGHTGVHADLLAMIIDQYKAIQS